MEEIFIEKTSMHVIFITFKIAENFLMVAQIAM